MNPFAKTHIDQINALALDLEKLLEEYERRVQRAQEDKESLMREHWALKRDFHALSETVSRLPEYEEENETLRRINTQSLEHARRILDFAKALSGALKK